MSDLVAQAIEAHIESLKCSLFGRAYDTGTADARKRVAHELAESFVKPVLAKLEEMTQAQRQHPSAHRADPDTWAPSGLEALTRDDARESLLGGSQGKSAVRTFPPSETNGSLVTPFTGAGMADQGEPPWHHSKEPYRDYLKRTGKA